MAGIVVFQVPSHRLLLQSSIQPLAKRSTRLAASASPIVQEEDSDKFPSSGCKSCGRQQVEKGCNGEGRIQGGIATVPGFRWWPIKAFRPCPGFVASGGRYRRYGQSMDEVAWGKAEREAPIPATDEIPSSKKSPSAKQFKG